MLRHEAQLRGWLLQYMGFRCPATLAAAMTAQLNDPKDAVFWAGRGGGKTLIGAMLSILECLFHPGFQVRILGGSLEQSRKMFLYVSNLLLPRFGELLARDTEAGAFTQRTIKFLNGSVIEILTHSERSVRGMRVNRVRCDEVELFDPEVWDAVQLTVESYDPARHAHRLVPKPARPARDTAADKLARREKKGNPPRG